MKTIKELVNESISEEAIQHKLEFAKKWGNEGNVQFYSDVVGNMERIIDSKTTEIRVHGDNSVDSFGNILSIHDPFIIRTKATYAAFSIFKEDLMHSNGELIYDETGWKEIVAGSNYWEEVILKECYNDGIILR